MSPGLICVRKAFLVGLSAEGPICGGAYPRGAYTVHKKSSVTKRSKIVNSLPRIITSTPNTLTAINFSLKNQGGGGH